MRYVDDGAADCDCSTPRRGKVGGHHALGHDESGFAGRVDCSATADNSPV